MKPYTMADIARMAGVNKSTVSRALSGAEGVNPATRERILRIARECDFTPNQAARTLATGTVKSIALIVMGQKLEPSMINTVFPQYILSIGQVAAQRGYHLIVLTKQASKDEEYLRLYATRQADGFIILNAGVDDTFPQLFAREGIPFVVSGPYPGIANSVTTDNELGGYLATKHLLELGHRRLVLLGGSMKWYHNQHRLQGARRAYEEYGLDYDGLCNAYMHLDTRRAYDTFAGLSLRGDLPDAVFCLCHTATLGFIAAAYDAGIQYPRDLSVITFSNQNSITYFRPALTAVEEEIIIQGETLATYLCDLIQDPQMQASPVVIPPTLSIRESTAIHSPAPAPGTDNRDKRK